MEHRIYRSIFTFIWLAFYSSVVFTIIFIGYRLFGKSIPQDLAAAVFLAIFVLSSFQSAQTVDIYYSIGMKFWEAAYLSFYEFWGQLFMVIQGKHKKQLPDKLDFDEEETRQE